jgi:hypothetical protein
MRMSANTSAHPGASQHGTAYQTATERACPVKCRLLFALCRGNNHAALKQALQIHVCCIHVIHQQNEEAGSRKEPLGDVGRTRPADCQTKRRRLISPLLRIVSFLVSF